MAFNHILIEKTEKIGVVRFNRPQVLNALCNDLTRELKQALQSFDQDDSVHVVILTGNDKAFAAGADIAEMKDRNFVDLYRNDFVADYWEQVVHMRKPIIAAVAGYALGGGCEIAMMCDFILAADNAKFGQPEITIGTLPGAGGTQRLTRLVGKSKAMEMCLTGRMIDAAEAEHIGLVARIFPLEGFMDEVMKIATKIAAMSLPVTMMAKEAVNRAYETTLSEGLRQERRLFQASFDLDDQAEGMAAFLEKRKPVFRNR